MSFICVSRFTLVILALNIFTTWGQKTERFNDDLMAMLANVEPVFILNPDEQHSMSKWAGSKTGALISASGVPEEAGMIIEQLGSLIVADEVDYIFFGMGSSNEELIRNVVNPLGILNDNKITVVIPHGYSVDAQMRLDSRLFLYEETANGITLYESYQIRNGPLIEQEIGTWKQDKGLMIYEPDMWQRRSNLHGATIRFTSINYPVLNTEFIYDNNENIIDAKGYLIDLLNMLKDNCNFTSTITYTIDGKFGGENEDGSWNGMVGMVKRDEADVVMTTLTLTNARKAVIDYTIPLFWEYMTLIAPKGQKLQVDYLVFLKIFPLYVYGMIFGAIFLFAVVFYLIGLSGIDNLHKQPDSERFGFTNSIGISMMFLMQLGYQISTKAMSTKVIYYTASVSMFCFYSYFACDLTARMTAGPAATPIRNFQDVIDGGYQVVTRPDTSNHRMLRDSEPGTAMHKIYYDTMHDDPDQFYIKIDDALDRITNSPATLYWAPKINIIGRGHLYEAIKIEEQKTSMTGWGIAKNSEYAGLLNYWLHKFDESGIRDRQWKWWTYKGGEQFDVDEAITLGFENITFPFLFIAEGLAGAFIFLIIEICSLKKGSNKKEDQDRFGNHMNQSLKVFDEGMF